MDFMRTFTPDQVRELQERLSALLAPFAQQRAEAQQSLWLAAADTESAMTVDGVAVRIALEAEEAAASAGRLKLLEYIVPLSTRTAAAPRINEPTE